MPVARISPAGLEIAKPGFDVDTAAPANMIFGKDATIQAVAMSGIVTLSTSTTGPVEPQPSTPWYNYGRVTFGRTFDQAPIIYAYGLHSGGALIDACIGLRVFFGQFAPSYRMPYYFVVTTTTLADFYALKSSLGGSGILNWRYFVMENTLQ